MSDQILHIAHVTAEMAPYAKSGGLGDVGAALPKALGKLGHRVTVILPRYGRIPYPAGQFVGSVHVPVDSVPRSAGFYRASPSPGVDVIFVEQPDLFDRPGLYGDQHGEYGDNRLRYAFLCRAALEYFRSRGERPDVFHAHDWQAGLLPVYLKAFYWDDPTLHRCPSVFTVHNVAYQGTFGRDTIGFLGLPWNLDTADALEFHDGTSYLKGGVMFSELVNTVSPRHAWEIQTSEYGFGFDGVMRARSSDLSGILNGVDYEVWDPRHDPHLAQRFGDGDEAQGKAACKADLLRSVGLPEYPDDLVVGIVSRLVHQKGYDVVAGAWWDLLQRPIRMVVLGQGERAVEDGFRHLEGRAPDRFRMLSENSESLAHKIVAGADVMLMPSRYEPCGLTQMYALRYGTVPLVRRTGGLADTVEPFSAEGGTGFLFDDADGTALCWALDQAIAAYRDRPRWDRLRRDGMSRDFSWERSARSYVELYRRAMERV